MKTQARRLSSGSDSLSEKIGCLIILIILVSLAIFIHKGLPTLAESYLNINSENSNSKNAVALKQNN